MTIEERKERFFKFEGCRGNICDECGYKSKYDACVDLVAEDARMIMKHSAGEEAIKEIIKPHKYETPLTGKDRELIKELIRVKTEVPDLSAHFIQEINELCVELCWLAATIGKMEQLKKGTDPVGKDESEEDLVESINLTIDTAISEAADVYNYLWAIGYSDKLEHFRENVDEKLARWANRLNGVSDE